MLGDHHSGFAKPDGSCILKLSCGAPTRGLSTASGSYPLSDYATLILTAATMADRNQTRFGQPEVSDETIGDPTRTVERAIEWLRQSAGEALKG